VPLQNVTFCFKIWSTASEFEVLLQTLKYCSKIWSTAPKYDVFFQNLKYSFRIWNTAPHFEALLPNLKYCCRIWSNVPERSLMDRRKSKIITFHLLISFPWSEYEPPEYEIHIERKLGQFGDGIITRVAQASISGWERKSFSSPEHPDCLQPPSFLLFNGSRIPFPWDKSASAWNRSASSAHV